MLAEVIVAIANSDKPGFRYPAGKQAEAFLPNLKQMNEKERDQFIRSAAGIDWWLVGISKPED